MAHEKLKYHARKLERHIKEFGNQTASQLEHNSRMADSFSEEARDNGAYPVARRLDQRAGQYEDAARDVREARQAVKFYGRGHNMAHHGEGKPHQGSKA